MKLALSLFVASLASSSAFTLPSKVGVSSSALRMADGEGEIAVENVAEVAPMLEEEPSVVVKEPEALMSQSLPFMARPVMLDGSIAGDVGFDPLGFAKSEADLMNYREAEIKHARLAMLAAAGWPVSELFDKKIANVFGATPVLDASDRAPSVLNGGLGKISPLYWVGCVVAAAAIDAYGISRSKSNDPAYFPGNLGFDPLGMYPKDEEGQQRMQLAEIKNGRLAMIAVTAFAFQEFVSKVGVVDETPIFFKPLGAVMREYANSGYYQP